MWETVANNKQTNKQKNNNKQTNKQQQQQTKQMNKRHIIMTESQTYQCHIVVEIAAL